MFGGNLAQDILHQGEDHRAAPNPNFGPNPSISGLLTDLVCGLFERLAM